MSSPEYSTLKKTLTRFRLSGLSTSARGAGLGITDEIERLNYIFEQNETEIGTEGCKELTREFQSPVKDEALSRPLRNTYQKVETISDGEIPEDIWQAISGKMDAGRNILVKGGIDDRKRKTVLAACERYRKAHPEYREVYLLVRECTKRTSEMELCFDRRRYTDNRIQLGYIAEGELLAKEHPEALVVLVLDKVDTMDVLHGLEGFFQFLEKNGNDKLISHDCLLTNMKNFMLFATENTENDNRNVSMDNPAVTQLFQSVSIWDLQMEKQARHRMV